MESQYIVVGRISGNENSTLKFSDQDVMDCHTDMTPAEYVVRKFSENEGLAMAEVEDDKSVYLDEFAVVSSLGEIALTGPQDLTVEGDKVRIHTVGGHSDFVKISCVSSL